MAAGFLHDMMDDHGSEGASMGIRMSGDKRTNIDYWMAGPVADRVEVAGLEAKVSDHWGVRLRYRLTAWRDGLRAPRR